MCGSTPPCLLFENYTMERKFVKAEKTSELAKRLWIKQQTIASNTYHFIGITFENAITRRNNIRKYWIRYIEISELKKVLPKEIILKWANEIKQNEETVG